MIKSGRLVVTHHSPWRGRLAQVIWVLTVILVGFGMYHFGQYRAGFNLLQAREEQAELQALLNQMQKEKAGMRDRIALIEQSSNVDAQAYQQVKDQLRVLQQENLELREEVSFYRGIVAPLESSAGIRVDRFKIVPSGAGNLYHYKFVITQVLKNDRLVRGVVKLKIAGTQNGKPKQLSLRKVSTNKKKTLGFKFRYFQKFEGDWILPKGFKPRQVLMEVHPVKRKIVKVEFDWPAQSPTKKSGKQ